MTALIYCPFPDAASAEAIGRTLIAERLIGSINLGGPIRALFCWNGESGEGEECAALLKTNAALLDRAIARLEKLHPYDAPAILGWRCDGAGAATSAWLGALDGAGKP